MNNFDLAGELDQAIERFAAGRASASEPVTSATADLVEIALELRTAATPDFKADLKAELLQKAVRRNMPALHALTRVPAQEIQTQPRPEFAGVRSEILPTLTSAGPGGYLLNQRSFAASLLMHVIVLALVISSGVWAARHDELKPHVAIHVLLPADYPLPAANSESHGGGSGGSGEKFPSSTGSPPRFSREQVTPPTIVVRNPEPRLPVDPTVLGPPEITFPPDRLGNPFSAAVTPSNGPGSGGGIGSNHGTGVGDGYGPGVGAGRDGGIGDGPYMPGGGVTAPRPIYEPEPEYSEEARRMKYQGDVVLAIIVGADGRARNIHVQRSLGMGLDEKAISAVTQWRFAPAMKDGHPVAVQVSIEVNFRLY